MNKQVGAPADLRVAAMPGSESSSASVRNRHKAHRLRIAGILLLLLVVGGGAAWWSTRGAPPVHYMTVPVTRGDVARTVSATGTVNPELTIIVGSYVSGVIQQLYCDYNTQVKAGQICAKIDPRPYQMVVNQAQAVLDVAKAQLEKDRANLTYAKLSFDRTLTLAHRDYSSQEAADSARNTYDQAQAQIGLDQAMIEQRQAELDAANVNLGYTDIVSPVDGTVVSRNVTQGQTVAASFQTPTLFLIATDLTKMQVDTNVSESDIGGIKDGDKATFTVDAFPDRIFEGTVTQVRQSPQTVQNVVTFDAVVSVGNRDLALKPGMTASTRIITEKKKDVLRVPNQALRYVPSEATKAMGMATGNAPNASPPTGGGQAILWALRDGQPVAISVVTGLDDDSYTEIVQGAVEPGDQAIVAEERGTGGSSSEPSPSQP
jgi:HlyD family secretion protein